MTNMSRVSMAIGAILVVLFTASCGTNSTAGTAPTPSTVVSTPAETATPSPTAIADSQAVDVAINFHESMLSYRSPSKMVGNLDRASQYMTSELASEADRTGTGPADDHPANIQKWVATVSSNKVKSKTTDRTIVVTSGTSRRVNISDESNESATVDYTVTTAIVRSGDNLLVDAYQVDGYDPVGEL